MKKIIFALAALVLFSAGFANGAQTATFYFSPPSGNFSAGQQFDLSIGINPQGGSFDTASVNVSFPADLLEIKSFALNPAFTSQSPDNSFNNPSGSLSYGAGIPGGSTQVTNFGTITFAVKKSGKADVSLAPGSLILSAGENVYSGAAAMSTFDLAEVVKQPEPEPQPQPQAQIQQKPVLEAKSQITQNEPVQQEQQEESQTAYLSENTQIPIVADYSKATAGVGAVQFDWMRAGVFGLFLFLAAGIILLLLFIRKRNKTNEI